MNSSQRILVVCSGVAEFAEVLRKYPDAEIVTTDGEPNEPPKFADLKLYAAADSSPPSRGPKGRRKFPVRR